MSKVNHKLTSTSDLAALQSCSGSSVIAADCPLKPSGVPWVGLFARSLVKLVFQRPKTGRALVREFTPEQIYFTGFQTPSIVIPVALVIGSTNITMFSKIPDPFDPGKAAEAAGPVFCLPVGPDEARKRGGAMLRLPPKVFLEYWQP